MNDDPIRWAQRRTEESNAAGITAAAARQKILEAMSHNNDKMTRAAAIAYAILIDKAQLLSGGGQLEKGSVVDDLASRRQVRRASSTSEPDPVGQTGQ